MSSTRSFAASARPAFSKRRARLDGRLLPRALGRRAMHLGFRQRLVDLGLDHVEDPAVPGANARTVRHSSSSSCSMLRAVSNSCSGRRTSSSAMSRKYIARKLVGSSSPRCASPAAASTAPSTSSASSSSSSSSSSAAASAASSTAASATSVARARPGLGRQPLGSLIRQPGQVGPRQEWLSLAGAGSFRPARLDDARQAACGLSGTRSLAFALRLTEPRLPGRPCFCPSCVHFRVLHGGRRGPGHLEPGLYGRR